jgi:hypothetical protein
MKRRTIGANERRAAWPAQVPTIDIWLGYAATAENEWLLSQ